MYLCRAVDPHYFFVDPDTAVLLNVDSDPAAFLMRILVQPNKNFNKLPYEEFSRVEKDRKDCSKVKNHGCDQYLEYGSGSRKLLNMDPMRIRIHSGSGSTADPDPQPGFEGPLGLRASKDFK